jgi:hypothetical protein
MPRRRKQVDPVEEKFSRRLEEAKRYKIQSDKILCELSRSIGQEANELSQKLEKLQNLCGKLSGHNYILLETENLEVCSICKKPRAKSKIQQEEY